MALPPSAGVPALPSDPGGAEEVFRALLEAAPDAMIMVDGAGRMRFVNHQAEALFGYERRDLLGQAVELLIPERFRGRHPGHRQRYLAAPQVRAMGDQLELFGRRKDGSEFPVEISLSPLRVAGELFVTSAIRDVSQRQREETERRKTGERLAELERLRQVDAFKTQFINAAAHELGTPLTPIRLQIQLLKNHPTGALSPEQRRSLEILDRNTERLARLVQDVLDVARLQSGRLVVHRKPLDLNRLVADAALTFEEAAKKVGVRLEVEMDRDLRIRADGQRITQVLLNLLSNALKFTPSAGTVRVTAIRRGSEAIVEVQDSGAGIAAESLGRLFQPFSQVHDVTGQPRTGTGLGLFISKGIVDQHEGRIWGESDGLGRGARFGFALPLTAEDVVPDASDASLVDMVEGTLARRLRELI